MAKDLLFADVRPMWGVSRQGILIDLMSKNMMLKDCVCITQLKIDWSGNTVAVLGREEVYIWSNIPLRLKEFSRPKPEETPEGSI